MEDINRDDVQAAEATVEENNNNAVKSESVKVEKTESKKPDFSNIPNEYKPISMWGYFGYEILFSLPIIGLIVLIIFSVGGTTNYNLRNYARSKFCLLIVLLALIGLSFLIIGTVASIEGLSNFKFPKY